MTHVCQHWRKSLVLTPENWTRISSKRSNLTALTLERSKGAPLKMVLNMNQIKKKPRFSSIIADHIKKTIELVFCEWMTIDDLFKTLPGFPQSMPNLQLLDLTLSDHAPNWDPKIDPFERFPPTIEYLGLGCIPLYQSFLNLRDLMELRLKDHQFHHTLDELLGFLEQNHSLKEASLEIEFASSTLRKSQHQPAVLIKNQFECLRVASKEAETIKALISSIPLQSCVHLEVRLLESSIKWSSIISDIFITHLANHPSPDYMKFHPNYCIDLSGPNGYWSFSMHYNPIFFLEPPPLLPYESIQELCLTHSDPMVFNPLLFPALETLVLVHTIGVSHVLSSLFSSPGSLPLFRTLKFENCNRYEDYMEKLVQFAVQRKNTSVEPLAKVVFYGLGLEAKLNNYLGSINALKLNVTDVLLLSQIDLV